MSANFYPKKLLATAVSIVAFGSVLSVAIDVKVTRDALIVGLRDGRVLSVPLRWYPRLAAATPGERRRWHWRGRVALYDRLR